MAAITTTISETFAQDATWRLVDNPYQEDLEYTVGEIASPRVEINGVRWQSFMVQPGQDPNDRRYGRVPVELTVEVENRRTESEKVLVILLLEDADGAPLDRIEVGTFKVPAGRIRERTESADMLGQVLLDTRRVYVFFEVME